MPPKRTVLPPFALAPAPDRYTHRLFRFPAKLHAPAARMIIERYTRPGDVLLDPFVGSGTVLLEASLRGRRSIGTDVDPLAVLVSRVKTTPLEPTGLADAVLRLLAALQDGERATADYRRLMFEDLSDTEFRDGCAGRLAPAIPNLLHWFRRYVVVDLIRIRDSILSLPCDPGQRAFLMVVFASIIRGSSNADPVPVSGLEVTSHMRRLDESGRLVNPYEQYRRRLSRALTGMADYWAAVKGICSTRVLRLDATILTSRIAPHSVDCVVTSPPYHGAVDYYRRHQLEMYWLGLTESNSERLALLEEYVGRPKVPKRHRFLRVPMKRQGQIVEIEGMMRETSPERADAFRHYCGGMRLAFHEIRRALAVRGAMVVVVGHSTWNGGVLNTSDLLSELAGGSFQLVEECDYPVRNRHMSYARHNGASIDREYVLVFRRAA